MHYGIGYTGSGKLVPDSVPDPVTPTVKSEM